MKKALFLLVLLAAGAVAAHYHVQNQHYFPVTLMKSTDGYTFHMVQNLVETRSECGKANDRFVEPLKGQCRQCKIIYARCERELRGLELKLLMGEPVQMHVVVAPGLRVGMEGPADRVKLDCEFMAESIVRAGLPSAACAFPGTARRP